MATKGKNKTISLRVSEEVFDFINDNASTLDISKSEFIIQSVLNANVQIDDKKKDRIKSLEMLNNINNKLNQIARKCDMSKSVDVAILEELILLEKEVFKQC